MKLVTLQEMEEDETKTGGFPYKRVGAIHINPEFVGLVKPARGDKHMSEVFVGHRYGSVIVDTPHDILRDVFEAAQESPTIN